MAHRRHTAAQHEEDDADRQKDVHNLPAAPCSSHPKHLWEENGNEQCVVLAHHGGNCASPAESELATSPLLLPTGLLPPVRCLKSIPRALQSCQTAFSQNTLSIHVLLHSPCAAGPFPADPLVPLKQQWVQSGGKSSWGAGGAEVPPQGPEVQGCAAAAQPSTRLTTLLCSSTPRKPQAECVSTRASHHRKK